MISTSRKRTASLLICLALVMLASKSAATAPPVLPNPVLYLLRQESYQQGGKQFTRYQYDVLNKADYPDALFAASPALPPCGNRTAETARRAGDQYNSSGQFIWHAG